ncbi:hypothetical protein VSH64_37635 [Amycolatopsis rhabdoformis]|uniref:Uncharacterized protein n=1 Tax=Amycolatopsis rhabdoformis TaxID=1448059 RepID=A0ABZ1I421_9PSEU|nr:hypothetical protein [Amycolatopsis rhabdoformis]WSE28511.1 hypothetical protein VSH64_37635 [Amycolatopsis rhabdoformis]
MREFTDTVRRELGGTVLASPEPGDAARMARRVLGTRARRRQGRLAGAVAVAVVLVLGVASVVTTATPGAPEAVAVTRWPARGALADNLGLVERARQAWGTRAAQVVYAGTSGEVGTVVVLSDPQPDGGVRLAFLTGTPELRVRARLAIPADQVLLPAFGFVAAEPGRALGVVVTAPDVTTAAFSGVTRPVTVHPADGLAAAVLAPAAAAWNTSIGTGDPQHPAFGVLTGSADDPTVSSGTVVRAAAAAQFVVSGVPGVSAGAVKSGDVVVTRAGFVAVVTRTAGDLVVVNSTPVGLRATTAAGVPVTLGGSSGRVDDPITVTAAGAEVRDGDRIVLSGFGRSAGVVELGTVHAGRLQRAVAVPADGAEVLLIHR